MITSHKHIGRELPISNGVYGTLSIVATPIGNLEDITFRALRVLKDADVVLCEDTRVTRKLLKHYEIETRLMRCDAHKEAQCAKAVIDLLKEGKRVAYVTDAGTPSVSDPGAVLVREVRRELPEATIETIPGASALTAALAIAGVSDTSFTFYGFVPHKKGRKTFFEMVRDTDITAVFYESPHRIEKTLAALAEVLPENRDVTVCRELTKLHEEVVAGNAAELVEYFVTHREKVRGEFVVVVSPGEGGV